jgi:tetratricopeptide (TPR) repeat protein
VQTIADLLGVGTVLEGSVRRDGEQLKVTTQLVDARDSRVTWSETYARELHAEFAMQEQIARDIVNALSLRLTGSGAPARLVDQGTESLEAYRLFVRGRYLSNTGERDNLRRAVQYFEEAVTLDSTYAHAFAGMAAAHISLGIFGYARPHDVFPRARAAAEHAIALDSMLVEGHTALAHQLFVYEFDWDASDQAFERALAVNPNFAMAHTLYGVYLHVTGRQDEAIAHLQRGRTLDPLGPAGHLMGRVHVNNGRPDDAIRHLNDGLELNLHHDLVHQQLAHAYLQKGMHAEAIASMRRAAELSGPRDSAQLAYVYATAGDRAEAQRVLQRLLDSAPERYLPPFHIAMAYAGLGDADAAFRWLDDALEQRASFMDGIAVAAGFERIRSDPRFTRLLRRMDLER